MFLKGGYLMNRFKKIFFLMIILCLNLSNYSNIFGMEDDCMESVEQDLPYENIEELLRWADRQVDARVAENFLNECLQVAACKGYEDDVVALLEAEVQVNVVDEHYYTPLHWAAMGGNGRVVGILLDHHAQVNARDFDMDTPLHWAAMDGRGGVIRILLAAGAQVNAKDRHGHTPLFWAAFGGYEIIVGILLDAGARVRLEDIDIAKDKKIRLLLQKAYKPQRKRC